MTRELNFRKNRKASSSSGFLDDLESLEGNETSKANENSKSNEDLESRETSNIGKIRENSESRNTSDFRESSETSQNRKTSDFHDTQENNESNKIENQTGKIAKSKKSKRKGTPYKTVGFQVDLDQLKELENYRRERRMAGDIDFSYRDAIRQALTLLFET